MSCLTGPAGVDPPERKASPIMTNPECGIGGVDSHKDTIHVAVITAVVLAQVKQLLLVSVH